MGNELLLPSADKRLSRWIDIQDKIKPLGEAKGKTIVISRRYGCQGYAIAKQLKELLDDQTGAEWTIFDKGLLELISEREHISKKLLEESINSESTHNFLSNFFPPQMEQEDYYKMIAGYIIELAHKGNAIIVGRGAEYLTQDLKNCYRFRIEADIEFRVQNMANLQNISLEEAKSLVKENENIREQFLEKHFSIQVSQLKDYHAIFNNRASSVKQIASAISAFAL